MSIVDKSIKCLFHFNSPYSLFDEAGNCHLLTAGSTSSSFPGADVCVPKFGTNTLYTNAQYVRGKNMSGIWNMNSDGEYEIEFFLKVTKITSAGLFRLLQDSNVILNLTMWSTGYLRVHVGNWGVFVPNANTGIQSITALIADTNAWHHMLLRVLNNRIILYIDGAEEINHDLLEGVVLNTHRSEIRVRK